MHGIPNSLVPSQAQPSKPYFIPNLYVPIKRVELGTVSLINVLNKNKNKNNWRFTFYNALFFVLSFFNGVSFLFRWVSFPLRLLVLLLVNPQKTLHAFALALGILGSGF